MNYHRNTETVLSKLVTFLLIVFVVNGKKAKKYFEESEYNSEDFNADVFCKKQSRLIKMEKADEIFVVDSYINNAILLQCKYCEEKDNGLPKTWSRQKHIFTGNITEVEADMDNNVSSSSIFISKGHSLVFRNLKETDLGLYFCKAPYIDTPDKSFNYLVDLNAKTVDEVRGTANDLKNYTQFFLAKVNNKLSNRTFTVHKISVKMKVFTDWSDWSECDSCIRKEGVRYRWGRCRVKPICQDQKECVEDRKRLKGFVFSDKQNSERPSAVETEITNAAAVEENIMEFGISLSCKSLLLQQLTPYLYNITSTIPDFVMSEKCSSQCKGRPLRKGPRYRKSIILAKGAHLTLVCPDSTIDSQVLWEHNQVRICANEGADYIPGTTEPRQYVDSFNTLYLFEVTDRESGNYTCFVDGIRMQEVKIIVLTRSLFFTKEFTKHLKYLGLVFMVCFIAYLAGVIVTCVKIQTEKKRNVRKRLPDSEKLLHSDCDSDSDL